MSTQSRISKIHVTLGLGQIPTVALEVDGRPHVECESADSENEGIYWLVARTINRGVGIEGVELWTCNCTTVRRKVGQNGHARLVPRDRVTVRLRRGGHTTRNTGAEGGDPISAFTSAYVAALNRLLQTAASERSVVLES